MRLVKFTLTGKDDRYIYINPAHVVAVEQFNNYTQIATNATNSDGHGRWYPVKEATDYVVSMLSV